MHNKTHIIVKSIHSSFGWEIKTKKTKYYILVNYDVAYHSIRVSSLLASLPWNKYYKIFYYFIRS